MSPNPAQPGKTARQARQLQQATRSAQDAQAAIFDNPPPTEPVVWHELAVQAVHNNYLICKHVQGSITFGDDVNVAKDPELRHTSDDGKTIGGLDYSYSGPQARTVTKNGTSNSQDQIVIPKYQVPSDGPAGYTGTVITAVPSLTLVQTDGGGDLWCQYREITQRAFANVEGAS